MREPVATPNPPAERRHCAICGSTGWKVIMQHSKLYGKDTPVARRCDCRRTSQVRTCVAVDMKKAAAGDKDEAMEAI
jgi:hypothetical protein